MFGNEMIAVSGHDFALVIIRSYWAGKTRANEMNFYESLLGCVFGIQGAVSLKLLGGYFAPKLV